MAEEQEKKTEKLEKKPKDDTRLIVRIVNIDLDGNSSIERSLTKIKGIGLRMAKNIASILEKETGVAGTEKLGKINEEQAKKLEEIIMHPEKNGIPVWSLNRQKDIYTGENKHIVMADLDFTLRTDLQRLGEIKSYRGLRHTWGLPVRGQSTKSTHRKKGSTVGVLKKDKK